MEGFMFYSVPENIGTLGRIEFMCNMLIRYI
jgi:hypothetical protein